MKKQHILSMTHDELRKFTGTGYKAFNSTQIFGWLYKKFVDSFDSMTNISSALRECLNNNFTIRTMEEFKILRSSDGTVKYGLRTFDGHIVESVLIFDGGRTTLCVSSQAGCPLECSFCLTGQGGFSRNLSAGEIIEQVFHAAAVGYIPTNIVFMGMGEPLLNSENLEKALDILFSPEGFNYSRRKITISTCGITDRLVEMEKKIPYLSWAFSLHAPEDGLRTSLMPVNRNYPLHELVDAMRGIRLKPGRFLTIEYIMIDRVNSSPEHAKKLLSLLSGIKYKVNLIPVNKCAGSKFEPPSEGKIKEFQNILSSGGIVAKIRKSKGDDISAACGQLLGGV